MTQPDPSATAQPTECNCGSHPLAPLYHRPECPAASSAQKAAPAREADMSWQKWNESKEAYRAAAAKINSLTADFDAQLAGMQGKREEMEEAYYSVSERPAREAAHELFKRLWQVNASQWGAGKETFFEILQAAYIAGAKSRAREAARDTYALLNNLLYEIGESFVDIGFNGPIYHYRFKDGAKDKVEVFVASRLSTVVEALHHSVHRNHEYAPDKCSGCESIKQILE